MRGAEPVATSSVLRKDKKNARAWVRKRGRQRKQAGKRTIAAEREMMQKRVMICR
jgi:hypothetical protein